MPTAEDQRAPPHAFWSGTISFGLVSIPVDLYAAVRPGRVRMHLFGPEGHRLARRYVCSEDGRVLERDEIVRGLPQGEHDYLVLSDEDLESLEPEKSRDINLQRFVKRDEIEALLLDHPYILAPSGQSTKAYHLLVETMQRSARAGIATFVMRGQEYLIAIFAEGGLLRAETLRFAGQLRRPTELGLPEPQKAPPARRKQMEAALVSLQHDELDQDLLRDETGAKLLRLARRKRAESKDVLELPETRAEDEEEAELIDIMHLLKERMGAA